MHETERVSHVVVRNLRPADLDAVIALDAKNVGRRRDDYFRVKLQQNLAETGIKVSLAAEVDGAFAGFLLARVYYGEFGQTEPVAVLDTIDVNPAFRGQGVGNALLEQLRTNLAGLGVGCLRTEVGWDELPLIGFFQHAGFHPAARLCLDLDLTGPRSERADG
ncbi:MAG TPA: GNAT family N-acetyltransferase [Candidatus Krumholzibacteria bacterium]|nr:GNAT family N-acetyltransferase [Candidatus Krumholzibacteria bacterium]